MAEKFLKNEDETEELEELEDDPELKELGADDIEKPKKSGDEDDLETDSETEEL